MFRRILQNQVPMMIMMIEMISMMMMMVTFDDNIDKAQRKANIMTFEANFTSFRNFYFVKKRPITHRDPPDPSDSPNLLRTHPTSLYDATDHINHIFSESSLHPLFTDPLTTQPSLTHHPPNPTFFPLYVVHSVITVVNA